MPLLKLRTAACLAALVFFAAGAQAAPDREHRIKAVFLYNFAQFVAWPDSAFRGKHDSLVVGVLGEDPFDAYLDEVVRGEKVEGRPIAVRRFRRAGDIGACHVLFISASESRRLDAVMADLGDKSILTVGESDSFIQRGGMVRFVTESGKIRLQINLEAVQKARLSVSAKLLRLADITAPPGGR
jgi:hypothetical protein